MYGKKLFLFVCLLMLAVAASAYAAPGVEVSGDLTLSGTGELVFPDGTAQTTASRPTWSQKITGVARWMLVLDDFAVLDKETGLVWQRDTPAVTYTWDSAITYCYKLILGGRYGWRLPTTDELTSLLENGSSPALPDGHLFTNPKSSYYWSATPYAGNSTSAWVIYFDYGMIGYGPKDVSYFVRCVRSGQ